MRRDAAILESYVGDLLQAMPDACFMADPAGRIVLANAHAESLFGYPKQGLQGKDVGELIPERFRGAHAAHYSGFLARPRKRCMGGRSSLRALRKDGRELSVEISLSPIATDRGVYVLGAVHEISDGEERYRAIFNQLAVGVVHSDLEGRVLDANKQFCQRSGYSYEEALNLDIRQLTHSDDLAKGIDARLRMLDGSETDYERELRLIAKRGTEIWSRVTTSLVRDATGRPLYFVSVLQDIARQRQAEEERRETELRFRQVTENIREVFWLTDPLKSEMLYVSPAYETIWGRSAASLVASPRQWLEAIHPEDRSRVLEAARSRQTTGEYDEEYRIVRPDGGVRWIRDRAFPVRNAQREVIRVAGVAEDVTERKQADDLHARLAAIVESSDDAIVGKNLDGSITSWNRGAERLLGYRADEAIGRHISLIVPQDRLAEEEEILERLRRGERVTHIETVRRRKDGGLIDVSLTISPIRDAQGRVVGASKIARDITQRKRADVKIRRLNRVYAVLSSINGLIVRARGRDELFRDACRIAVEEGNFKLAWLALVEPEASRLHLVAWRGAGEGYVERMPLALTATGAGDSSPLVALAVTRRRAAISNDLMHDPRVVLKAESFERGFRSVGILPLLVADEVIGALALYADEVDFFDDDEMKLLHELAGDIAFALDHIEKSNKVDYLALYDQLTGLANRTLFLERLNPTLHASRIAGDEFALVLADVERLRTVNDSLGRQAGDDVLKQVAERLSRGAEAGTLARIGGDVFAIVLQGVGGRSGAERRTDAVWHEVFGKSLKAGEADIRIAAKAGIALFPRDGADAEALLQSAETALRQAKESGERFVFHAPEMTEQSAERLSLETRLRRALERDELVLHYQPKVELHTRRVAGVEALIRWQSPDMGLVPPGRFVPLMEETGLILEAGAWALARAVADQQRWLQQGLPVGRVAVNVSPVQLRKRDFVDTVADAVKRGSVPPAVDLEITESLLMEDVEVNIQKLKRVRDLGIGIAIDDFGTGYSSLGYLAKLPVQTIKIDCSFIATMLTNPDTMTLVQTIISLAHSLKLTVVAEGVESEEQAKILHLLRCDAMQGYLFSRAVPFGQMAALLEREIPPAR